jgi:hypothetical protein
MGNDNSVLSEHLGFDDAKAKIIEIVGCKE